MVLSNYDLDHRITPLAEKILRVLGLNRLEDLVGWATKADKMAVAQARARRCSPLRVGVTTEMTAAIQIGARMLADFTCAVARRLEFDAPDVQLLGGLFVHHPEYFDLFKDYLSENLPNARVEICTESGAMGAAWLAADLEMRNAKRGMRNEDGARQ